MNTRFLAYLKTLGLTQSDRILLAVSGGLDSMVMLHLFATTQFTVAVAHANFQLRGNESESDEIFVKEKSQQYGIPFFSTRFDTNNYAITHKLSIQMAARQLRYSWFDQILATGYSAVATAHHLNDSLETVLLNLTRGSGLEGMAGILPKSDSRIRPLLFATRFELEQYAAENSICWREDFSNQTDDYQRNFIRHKVVPLLKEVNPALEETFLETSKRWQQEIAILRQEFSQWKAKYTRFDGDVILISKSGLEDAFAQAHIWQVLRPHGFSYTQCANALEAMHGQPGKYFISPTHQLTIDRVELLLTRLPGEDRPVQIEETTQEVVLGGRTLTLDRDVLAKPAETNNRIVIDAAKIKFPLTWRKWQPGDSFYPLGLRGRKKISDFLVDNKVPRALKEEVTVLECHGDIVWLVGMRLDDRYKLTQSTRKALAFSLTPHL